MRVFRIKLFCVAVIGALALVGGALAAGNQTPPTYRGTGGNVQEQVKGEGANTLGSLPFTGLDLALIVGGGLVLVIAGVSIRRLAARRP
jgi:hypothetical protein